MGVFVIAAYRPRKGKEERLLDEVRQHVSILRAEGLVTERQPYVMRSKDGTLLEVFEWKSEQAVEDAHRNDAVQKMWARFEEVCEYAKLSDLAEAAELFPHFEPV